MQVKVSHQAKELCLSAIQQGLCMGDSSVYALQTIVGHFNRVRNQKHHGGQVRNAASLQMQRSSIQ